MQAIKDIAGRILPGNGFTAPAPTAPNTAERVTLSQLDAGHHPLVDTAVKAAYRWLDRKRGYPAASLVLVASQVKRPDGTADINRTGYGCGKTHIARAIMWAQYIAREDGVPVAPCGRFFMARDLIELLRGNSPAELVPRPSIVDGSIVGGAHAVVIDDVGTEGVLQFISKEAQTAELHARYFEVVNYCYTAGISVIITANMTLDQLATHLGGRCWSRLLEMAPAGFMIDLTGVPDYRRKGSGR